MRELRIKYNCLIPFPGFAAINLFGTVFARHSQKPLSQRTINHERIHTEQAQRVGGWLIYYIMYVGQWVACGFRYSRIAFEIEAYKYEGNITEYYEKHGEAVL